MNNPAIETVRLRKSYGHTLALTDLSVSVEAGEVYGFVGPNGAGKTSTIRILIGLVRPDSGTVSLLGEAGSSATVREDVGYCSAESICFKDVTVARYLRLLCSLRRESSLHRAMELAERLALPTELRIKTLSRGNHQKINIIQALMDRPRLLIMDEPTVGLDPVAQSQLLELLSDLREDGTAIFISSHQLYDIERISDRIGFIRRGELLDNSEISRLRSRMERRITVTFVRPPSDGFLGSLAGYRPERLGQQTLLIETSEVNKVIRDLMASDIADILVQPVGLETLFRTLYMEAE